MTSPPPKVNNQVTTLPATLEAGKIQLSRSEGRTILQTAFGLQVTYDEDLVVMVAVPSSYFGATCGLCGNFNEDAEDEAAFANGTQAAGADAWAESWRDASCRDDCGDGEADGCGEQGRGSGGGNLKHPEGPPRGGGSGHGCPGDGWRCWPMSPVSGNGCFHVKPLQNAPSPMAEVPNTQSDGVGGASGGPPWGATSS